MKGPLTYSGPIGESLCLLSLKKPDASRPHIGSPCPLMDRAIRKPRVPHYPTITCPDPGDSGNSASGSQVRSHSLLGAMGQDSNASPPHPPPRPAPACLSPPPALCSQPSVPSAPSHRATLEVIVESLVKQMLLTAACRTNEAEVNVVVGAREPLAAGGYGDGVGRHGSGK